MKFFLSFSIFILLSACGGGGGGSGGTSSSVTALDWSTSLSTTRGMTATFKASSSGGQYTNAVAYDSEGYWGGMNFSIDSTTDNFSIIANNGLIDPDLNVTLTPAHISSGPTVVTDSYASTNSLTTTNYTYSFFDSSIQKTSIVTIAIPSNYPNQVWVYWDNTNQSPSTYIYNQGVTGVYTPFASIPSSGTATYTGGIEGAYTVSSSDYVTVLGGSSTFNVNWGTNKVSGSFHNLTGVTNGVSSGFNTLNMGETNIISSYGSYASFSGLLSGTGFTTYSYNNHIYGTFMGSNYESIGGVWGITNNAASGSGAGYFAAKK